MDHAKPLMADESITIAARPLPSRTTAILVAIRQQLEARRELIDRAEDLGAFTLTVKLHIGTTTVKSVVCSDERINRRLPCR